MDIRCASSVQQAHETTSHKPGLKSLLGTLGLDVEYHRASGQNLYYRDSEGSEIEVVDLVGGYGTLLLGHNPPDLVAEAMRFLASGLPNHTQGAIRAGAEHLAQMLSLRAEGDFCAVFANSGTEAVEAAIKHALLETGGRTLICLEGGFHGKTTGALQLTANPHFRRPFATEPINVVRVRPNDIAHLRTVCDEISNPAGLIFEPVQGEAGVRPLCADFLQQAAALCAGRGIPLIADECQTGLGRTGTFLASHALGLSPDYVILAKVLGGGLAKISALLIRRERYQTDFDLLHSSTFADDEFSSAMAIKVLELVDDETMHRCRLQGSQLLQSLETVRQRYPAAIRQVRGTGLLLGIELERPSESSGFLLNFLTQRNLLGPLVAGYLLREHGIRIATSLSDSFTLRIQPAVDLSIEQVGRFLIALEDVCRKLCAGDVAGLMRFLAVSSPTHDVDFRLPGTRTPIAPIRLHPPSPIADGRIEKSSASSRRVAWLFHFIDENDLTHLEPALEELTLQQRAAFLDRTAALAEPVVLDVVDILSDSGETVQLYPILLPVTSAWLLHRRGGRGHQAARRLIQQGVDSAAALECRVVTLGQFTSSLAHGGKSLQHRGCCINTGNRYTTALIAQSLDRVLSERELDRREMTLAVIGAAGDIGRSCTQMLAAGFRRSILVGTGKSRSHRRLSRLASAIPGGEPAADFSQVRCADVVICATNCLTAPLGTEHLHPRSIVCDVSVPSMLSSRKAEWFPEITILSGGVVKLPGREDLQIPGFPLPAGLTYGCMAEGLLLGLEGIGHDCWQKLSLQQQTSCMIELARRHGFEAAGKFTAVGPSKELTCRP